MNRVIENIGPLGYLLRFAKKNVRDMEYSKHREIIKELDRKENIMMHISKDIHIEGTVLEKLKKLEYMKGEEYDDLYNEVIQVGEYKNN